MRCTTLTGNLVLSPIVMLFLKCVNDKMTNSATGVIQENDQIFHKTSTKIEGGLGTQFTYAKEEDVEVDCVWW